VPRRQDSDGYGQADARRLLRAFLPRSFRGLYESASPAPGEERPVWTPFEPRLADARIALLSSAGLHVDGEQPAFDVERERREPTWGDPSWRAIPGDAMQGSLE
jgi:hypothetical protein